MSLCEICSQALTVLDSVDANETPLAGNALDFTLRPAISANGRIVGFTQLYPGFSSVSMKRVWILNDLFVDEGYRGQGVAKSLMSAAENFARETECVRIVLATQISNVAAQSLYESRGYAKDEEFYHYALRL